MGKLNTDLNISSFKGESMEKFGKLLYQENKGSFSRRRYFILSICVFIIIMVFLLIIIPFILGKIYPELIDQNEEYFSNDLYNPPILIIIIFLIGFCVLHILHGLSTQRIRIYENGFFSEFRPLKYLFRGEQFIFYEDIKKIAVLHNYDFID